MDTTRVGRTHQWPASIDAALFDKLAELSTAIADAVAHAKTRPDPAATLGVAVSWVGEIADLADWPGVRETIALQEETDRG